MPATAPVTLDENLVLSLLPKRPPGAHKGSFGTLGIFAGSLQYRGAALLCADAALRAGAGIVRLASVEAVCAAAAVRLPCCVLLPLPQAEDGCIGPSGAEILLQTRHTALLAGCGLGNTAATAQNIRTLLQRATAPTVLDADALNALAPAPSGEENPDNGPLFTLLKSCPQPLVLTPHLGEMARLLGTGVQELLPRREQAALDFARLTGCVVVQKSASTLIACPKGELYLHVGAENPGLAKGGSGDVLAGIIASLLAQGLPAPHAAAAGVWLHGQAGEAAARECGHAGLSPAELPTYLARVQRSLGL